MRKQLGVSADDPLPYERAFQLKPNVHIQALSDIPAAQVAIRYWLDQGKGKLSGCALPLPDGHIFVIYNDAHPVTRVRVTLMEEFFHIHLGHAPTVLRLTNGTGGWRTHNPDVESEAYGCAAAALVPYESLRRLTLAGNSDRAIGQHFGVSPQLVAFRQKITRLYRHRKVPA